MSLTIDSTKIQKIRHAKSRRDEVLREIDDLSRPFLTDLDFLPSLYDIFKTELHDINPFADPTAIFERKEFLLIAIYLYSPRSLGGIKMKEGLRRRLAEIFGLVSQTTISDSVNSLMVYYRNYRDFRSNVDEILRRIDRRLGLTN